MSLNAVRNRALGDEVLLANIHVLIVSENACMGLILIVLSL